MLRWGFWFQCTSKSLVAFEKWVYHRLHLPYDAYKDPSMPSERAEWIQLYIISQALKEIASLCVPTLRECAGSNCDESCRKCNSSIISMLSTSAHSASHTHTHTETHTHAHTAFNCCSWQTPLIDDANHCPLLSSTSTNDTNAHTKYTNAVAKHKNVPHQCDKIAKTSGSQSFM